MGKSGNFYHNEPEGSELIECNPKLFDLLSKSRWVTFCFISEGFHYEVARAFTKGFHEKIVNIADLSFSVTEETIAEAMGLLIDGEKWFKNQTLIGINIKLFLKDKYVDEDLRRNIQRSW